MPWGTIEERHASLLNRTVTLKRGTAVVYPPIRCRIVSLEHAMVRGEAAEEGGRSPEATEVLVTTETADIRRDDMFRVEGQTYVVLDVTPASSSRADNPFRKVAYLKVRE